MEKSGQNYTEKGQIYVLFWLIVTQINLNMWQYHQWIKSKV